MKKKVILFDFDKTLTDEDSIFLLWKYAFSKKKTNIFVFGFKMIKGFFKYLFTGLNFIMIKNEMCSVLKYFNEDELEEFVDYIYKNHILQDGVDYFKTFDYDSYKMLVSASPINYLKYLNKYFDFDMIMGTNLNKEYQVVGKNNKSSEKVRRIRNHLREKDISIEYEISLAFSDSFKDDRPMLQLVKNRYLINSDIEKKGFNNLNWK